MAVSVPTRPSAASLSVPSPGEDRHHLDALGRGTPGEPGRVAPAGRLDHLEVVVRAQRLLDDHPPAGRHRRRGGVDDEEDTHDEAGYRSCRAPPRRLDARDRRLSGVSAPGRVARDGRPATSGPRSATTTTGGGRCPGSATRGAGAGARARAGGARANRTGRVFTGDRSGDWLFAVDAPVPGSRTSRRRSRPTTGCASSTRTSRPPCAARRPRTSRRATSATGACPYFVRELALLDRRARDRDARRVRVRGAVGGAARRRRGAAPPAAEVRARRRGADDAGHDRRLLPPESAEHVHRASSPSRCSTRCSPGPGSSRSAEAMPRRSRRPPAVRHRGDAVARAARPAGRRADQLRSATNSTTTP